VDRLLCKSCGTTYPMNDPRWRCDCGGLLDIRFRTRLDRQKIVSRKPTMWRYREALPIGDDANVVSFEEGMTPMIPVDLGPASLLLKLEQLFPTGSYKDRGASVLISKAKELGVTRIVEDSSGNAGCAIAAYAAKAGIGCEILVPENTSPGKLAQILLYGAALRRVPGSREDTANAALAAAIDTYYASHSWNPFFFQGTKTFAYEVWEQMGFRAPDALLLPAGNGTLLIGSFIGFRELQESGLVDKIPRHIAVQAENCAPLLAMFRNNLDLVPPIETRETIAEGVAIAAPVRGKEIVDIVRKTGGEVVAVSDAEVEKALILLGRRGLYVEPTSALPVAAFLKYPAVRSGIVVAPLTGHGLKANEKMQKIAPKGSASVGGTTEETAPTG
jgi:threonine synthase